MKFWICILMCCCFFGTKAQQRSVPTSPLVSLSPDNLGNRKLFRHIEFHDFRPRNQRYTSPRLTQATPSISDRRSSNYWANSVTTQSYGEGKWGTLYYWDVQGNLREAKGFIDIAGKNKRGLKLVFPWR